MSDRVGLIRHIGGDPGRHLAISGTLNFRDTGGYPITDGSVAGGYPTAGGAVTGGAVTGGAVTGGAVTGGAVTDGSVAGGYPTAGGAVTDGAVTGGAVTGGAVTTGVTAWRRLLRSDGLHRLDGAGLGQLGSLGLRTVLDLRTNEEAQIAQSPLDAFARAGALTMQVSLIGEDFEDLPADLAAIYDFIIDRRGAAIAASIRVLARPGGLPALVHCTAGKDRTGIVIAFTLAAIGVPDRFVAADYALSSLYLDPQHTPTIGRVQESSGLGERLTAAMLASPPELIIRALDRARRQAGSVTDYLAWHGVTCAELAALRSALVTEGEGHDEGG